MIHRPRNRFGDAMTLASARVCKMTGRGNASAAVYVGQASGIEVGWQLLEPLNTVILSGELCSVVQIEAECLAGIRRVRKQLNLVAGKFIVRRAKARIKHLADLDGIALATMMAVARALGRENEIPSTALMGAGGEWETVHPHRQSTQIVEASSNGTLS